MGMRFKYYRDTGKTQRSIDVYSNDKATVALKGRKFGRWISDSGRSTGYSILDFIENPIYVIESLIRDELWTEHNIDVVSYDTTLQTLDVRGLKFTATDFYKEAYVHDLSGTNTITYQVTASSYNSETGVTTLTIDGSASFPNKINLTNIRNYDTTTGTFLRDIDTDSFDAIGNTTNGYLNGKKMLVSYIDKMSFYDAIDDICSEFFILIGKNAKGVYYAKCLVGASTIGTFDTPLVVNGNPKLYVSLTPLSEVYSAYETNYGYSYNTGEYNYNISNTTINDYSNYCKTAKQNYRVDNKLVTDARYIKDKSTAQFLHYNLMHQHYKRRVIINMTTQVQNYIEYEVGDFVKVNYPDRVPLGVNNTSKFLIIEKNIRLNHIPQIDWTLVEYNI